MIKHFCDHCGKDITETDPTSYKYRLEEISLAAALLDKKEVLEFCKDCDKKFREFTGLDERSSSKKSKEQEVNNE